LHQILVFFNAEGREGNAKERGVRKRIQAGS